MTKRRRRIFGIWKVTSHGLGSRRYSVHKSNLGAMHSELERPVPFFVIHVATKGWVEDFDSFLEAYAAAVEIHNIDMPDGWRVYAEKALDLIAEDRNKRPRRKANTLEGAVVTYRWRDPSTVPPAAWRAVDKF